MTEDIIVNLPTNEQSIELLNRIGIPNTPASFSINGNSHSKLNWLMATLQWDIDLIQDLAKNLEVPYGHQVFLTSGTFTVPKSVKTVYVTMVAGGGGGGASTILGSSSRGGSGGGPGTACYRIPIDVSNVSAVTVTVGIGGNGGGPGNPNGNPGQPGSASGFKDISVGGGNGGNGGTYGDIATVVPGVPAGDFSLWLGKTCYNQLVSEFLTDFSFLSGFPSAKVNNVPTGSLGGNYIREQGAPSTVLETHKFHAVMSKFGITGRGIGGDGGSGDRGISGPGRTGIKGGDGAVIIEWGGII